MEAIVKARIRRKRPPPAKRGQSEPKPSLRQLAMVYYCYEHPETSIAQMATVWPFSQVSRRTLELWSTKDGWQERRAKAEEEWNAKVRDRIGNELAQARVKQLQNLEQVNDQMLDEIKSGQLKWRSMESAILAFVRLAVFTDSLREKVLTAFPGQKPAQQLRTPVLSSEEARTAAKAIMAFRREKARRAIARDALDVSET